MSHFKALVLVPGELGKKKLFSSKNPKKEIFEAVMDLIFPYAFYFPAIDYQVPCFCLPHDVMTSGMETANQEIGEFWELYRDMLKIPENIRPDWSEYKSFKEWERICQEATKQNIHFNDRDSNCDHCNGSGFRISKDNFSRYEYDYFNIADLDPAVNPKLNQEFFIYVEKLDSEEIDYEAIVTPDGCWHNIEWGSASEDPVAEWEKRSHSILERYLDHIAFISHMHK